MFAGDSRRGATLRNFAVAMLGGVAKRQDKRGRSTKLHPSPHVLPTRMNASSPTSAPRGFTAGVALMLVATAAVAASSPLAAIGHRPGTFVALIAAVLVLDLKSIDVFGRGQVSPAAVPAIALAMLFGPLGPICAEAVIAASRAARRMAPRIWLADLGMLSLTGAATAGVWSALGAHSHLAVLAGGMLAGATSYLVNAALIIWLTSLRRSVNPLAAWRESWAWLWPHYLGFGLLAGALVMADRALGVYGVALLAMPVALLWLGERQYVDRSRAAVEELRELVDEKQALIARMHRSYLSTITALARTIEAKDPNTGDHTERVAQIACLLAGEMGYDPETIRAIEVGAIVHDIGKIGVPDRVLLKPGALEPEEFAQIRRHPEISSYILADLDLPLIVKQMVRSHHERYDGRGYPDGLAGEEIPLAARILSVADTLDAMTSDRPYRRGLPLDDALAEIEAGAGGQFCPRVVEALVRCWTGVDELVHAPAIAA